MPGPDRVANDAIKINIGCGLSGVPGWVNVDNSPTILIYRVPLLRRLMRVPAWPSDVRRLDVRKGLPFPDASVRCIYSSHTFEHFTYDESVAVSKECFRVLQPDGWIRIAVPDLALIVNQYLSDDAPLASHRFVARLSLNRSFRDILHPGSNHSQMFDGRSLVHLLKSAGFANPKVSSYRDSSIPDVEQIELAVRRAESLYVEAKKDHED
jgi:predicted SAM-dependent methyltransferase